MRNHNDVKRGKEIAYRNDAKSLAGGPNPRDALGRNNPYGMGSYQPEEDIPLPPEPPDDSSTDEVAEVHNGTGNTQFDVVTLSDVVPEKVAWLWKGWLPLGKVVTLDGDPGLGKSTLALTFSAIITTGGMWPDETRCEYPGDVILFSAEDGLADTVRPRLDSAGGDPAKVHAVQGVPLTDNPEDGLRMPTLADIQQLRAVITRYGARLVIIDVLMAYLPSHADSHRDQDVRRVLGALSALAADTGCTILLLRHLNKAKGGDPMYRGGGSIGIVGAARAGLLVASDPDDDEVRVLASIKNNLAAASASLAYKVVKDELRDVSQIKWVGASQHDAYALLADTGTHVHTTVDEARDWLEDYLTAHDGVAPSKDAKAEGKKEGGFSERSIERAASKLKVAITSAGYPRRTYWTLPGASDATPPNTGGTDATGATDADQHDQKDGVGATDDATDTSRASRASGVSETSPGNGGVTGRFQPPTGPNRCPSCGWDIPDQGHEPSCPAKE